MYPFRRCEKIDLVLSYVIPDEFAMQTRSGIQENCRQIALFLDPGSRPLRGLGRDDEL
jgi:hypothetical protein